MFNDIWNKPLSCLDIDKKCENVVPSKCPQTHYMTFINSEMWSNNKGKIDIIWNGTPEWEGCYEAQVVYKAYCFQNIVK